MRKPIDLHGQECVVRYPSSIYSLERHESLPHERFSYNVLSLGIEALHQKQLPEQVTIEFPPSTDRMPAWLINASIRPQLRTDGKLLGFIIAFPELLPTMVMLFAHIVSKQLDESFEGVPVNEMLETVRTRIQEFVDIASKGVREYRSNGLASAIRVIYVSAGITLPLFQESFDYFDSISQFIANHEIAHAYIGQLHAVRAASAEESKAFEFIADLLGTNWLFNHFVLNTPDTEEYRKMREHKSYAESLEANIHWLIQTGAFLNQ